MTESPFERGVGAESTIQRPVAPCDWRDARGEAVN